MFDEETLVFSFNILGVPKKLLRIFKILAKHKGLTIKELSEHLGISIRTVYEHVTQLMKHGLIKRVPSEKNGRLVYVYEPIPRERFISIVKSRLKEYMEAFEEW